MSIHLNKFVCVTVKYPVRFIDPDDRDPGILFY